MNDKKNVRMCVCCRERREKSLMVRVSAVCGVADVDTSRTNGGRGAYVCSPVCLENSLKGRRLDRALKCRVSDEVYDKIRTHLQIIEKRES